VCQNSEEKVHFPTFPLPLSLSLSPSLPLSLSNAKQHRQSQHPRLPKHLRVYNVNPGQVPSPMLHLLRSFTIKNSILVQSPDMAEEKKAADRSRGWCFTFNNYQNTQDYDRKMRDAFPQDFVIYGKEVGDSGTPHLQGFIYSKNPLRFATLKERFDRVCAGVHIEKARTTKAAIAYCKKGSGTPSAPVDPDVVQWGAEPGQGQRNDLELAAALIEGGASNKRLAEECATTFIKYNKGLQALRGALHKPFEEEKEVIWCWGPSNSGKTSWARNYLTQKHGDYYEKSSSTKWWDQYEHDKGVLIDEFRDCKGPDMISFRDLLTLLGKGKKIVEYKGGSAPFCAETIIITSLYSPEELYGESLAGGREEMVQLTRRINKCIQFQLAADNAPRQMEKIVMTGYRPGLPADQQYQVINLDDEEEEAQAPPARIVRRRSLLPELPNSGRGAAVEGAAAVAAGFLNLDNDEIEEEEKFNQRMARRRATGKFQIDSDDEEEEESVFAGLRYRPSAGGVPGTMQAAASSSSSSAAAGAWRQQATAYKGPTAPLDNFRYPGEDMDDIFE